MEGGLRAAFAFCGKREKINDRPKASFGLAWRPNFDGFRCVRIKKPAFDTGLPFSGPEAAERQTRLESRPLRDFFNG